jgi:hypothetical protein
VDNFRKDPNDGGLGYIFKVARNVETHISLWDDDGTIGSGHVDAQCPGPKPAWLEVNFLSW